MSEIDWSNAPEWADRVVRSPRKLKMFWANDDERQTLDGSRYGVNTQHVRDNWEVVSRRPTADTGIDWNEAPHWADRVVKGPMTAFYCWANDEQRVVIDFESKYAIQDNQIHMLSSWEVVERRPISNTVRVNARIAPVETWYPIEQRLASLRALEKQVEETRAELTRDLEAFGLTWMVRGDPIDIETPPDITNWRDLRVGDVIGFDGVDGEWDILNLEDEYDEAPIKVSDDINAECTVEGWVNILSHPWRFIRRP